MDRRPGLRNALHLAAATSNPLQTNLNTFICGHFLQLAPRLQDAICSP